MTKKNALLFNPVGVVHDRNVDIFRKALADWDIRRIYNPRHSWFADGKKVSAENNSCYFRGDYCPKDVFADVKAVVLFSAQPRIPHANLIQEATARNIPVIAIEEVYQMMLEQGYVNEYFLPVDHLFVGSEYEKEMFLRIGAPKDVVEVTGIPFSYRRQAMSDLAEKREFRRSLGVPDAKKVATLSLAYYTLSGETVDIRRRLLECVSHGLPRDYELVVKPHPAEKDADIEGFIKRYAPHARTVNRYTPISKVLDITDVLLNRGNSQVVIDALERDIPVVAIPMGRRTLFHDLSLDEVIANDSGGIVKALDSVAKKGMGIYGRIFRDYLSILPETAVEHITNRIAKIAGEGSLYNPEGRLMQLALFWAWMGHVPHAVKILSGLKGPSGKKTLLKNIGKLVLSKADRADLAALKNRCPRGTLKEWILQSLWIRTLYMNSRNMSAEERDWLADYPPRMNRESFLPFTYMLYWTYLKSGFCHEAGLLLDRLDTEYGFLDDVKRLRSHERMKRPRHGDFIFWDMRSRYTARTALKDLLFRLRLG